LRAIAAAFNAFVRQLELGDHRDAENHPVLMNRQLVESETPSDLVAKTIWCQTLALQNVNDVER